MIDTAIDTTMDLLLSVDPGQHSAYALWRPSAHDVWGMRAVGRLKSGDAVECFTVLGALSSEWRGSVVVVESQWYAPPRPVIVGGKYRGMKYSGSPFGAVMTLHAQACAWRDAALISGARVEDADPRVWVKKMTAGIDIVDTKKRIEHACKLRFPEWELVKDEHDAAMIGAWYLINNGKKIDCRKERAR